VAVRDLYQLNFDPVLSLKDMDGQRKGMVFEDVEREKEYILWAERVIIIHPIWWTGLPAIMKGYIDRVFSYGFAYSYNQGVQKGLLSGKQMVVINTHGKSQAEYRALGMAKALALTSDTGIYTYCGFEIVEHFYIDQADRTTPEAIGCWTEQIKEVLQNSSAH